MPAAPRAERRSRGARARTCSSCPMLRTYSSPRSAGSLRTRRSRGTCPPLPHAHADDAEQKWRRRALKCDRSDSRRLCDRPCMHGRRASGRTRSSGLSRADHAPTLLMRMSRRPRRAHPCVPEDTAEDGVGLILLLAHASFGDSRARCAPCPYHACVRAALTEQAGAAAGASGGDLFFRPRLDMPVLHG
jgi:hypothetical protein